MEEGGKKHVSISCMLNHTKGYLNLSVTTVSCSLSMIGVVAILYSYAKLRTIRDDTRLLLIFLAIADFLTAAGYLIGPIVIFDIKANNTSDHIIFHGSPVCVIQSFVTIFSSMASFFWTLVIAIHIYCHLVYNRTFIHRRIVFFCVHLICWGVPAVISISALMLNVLGANWESTGPWCWIKSDLEEDVMITWMLVTGKGWEFLFYLLSANLYMLAKVQIYIKRRRRPQESPPLDGDESQTNNIRSHDFSHGKSFLYLLMALYLLRVWGSSRFVINVLTKHLKKEVSCTLQYVLLIFQSYGDSGQGFWNFVIFCCVDKVARSRLFSRCCRRNDYSEDPGLERQRLLRNLA